MSVETTDRNETEKLTLEGYLAVVQAKIERVAQAYQKATDDDSTNAEYSDYIQSLSEAAFGLNDISREVEKIAKANPETEPLIIEVRNSISNLEALI